MIRGQYLWLLFKIYGNQAKTDYEVMQDENSLMDLHRKN